MTHDRNHTAEPKHARVAVAQDGGRQRSPEASRESGAKSGGARVIAALATVGALLGVAVGVTGVTLAAAFMAFVPVVFVLLIVSGAAGWLFAALRLRAGSAALAFAFACGIAQLPFTAGLVPTMHGVASSGGYGFWVAGVSILAALALSPMAVAILPMRFRDDYGSSARQFAH